MNNTTQTPQFKRWFGGSKVVDKNGNPLVVFHGTKSAPKKFLSKRTGYCSTCLGSYEIDRYGIFAAEDVNLAHEYMNQGDEEKSGHSIMPLYMRIESPLDTIDGIYSDGLFNTIENTANKMGFNGYLTARILGEKWGRGTIWTLFDKDEHNDPEIWIKLFKILGYDGLKIYDKSLTGANNDVWVAFDPEQVKSATGNIGSFDDKEDFLKETVEKVGFDPSDEHSDLPINWEESDIQVGRKWDVPTIREFLGLPNTFIAIYRAIVETNDLDPKLAEDDPDIPEEGRGGYEWEEFRFRRRGFPPVLITREVGGRLVINDGNHRVYWAQKNNLRTIGVWVVDKLIQKDIDSKKRINETRIYPVENALFNEYITLYHGTTWPIALKAKKGQLGPMGLENLIIDVLVKVFHETPSRAKEIYLKNSSNIRREDPNVLFFTTVKDAAEGYAKSATKYGGEIFLDVLGQYLWDRDVSNYEKNVVKHLQTDEPAVVTINVPISMVLTHPHWKTPLKDRLKDIIDNAKKHPDISEYIRDLRIEVFVRDVIPKRFVERIDKVSRES